MTKEHRPVGPCVVPGAIVHRLVAAGEELRRELLELLDEGEAGLAGAVSRLLEGDALLAMTLDKLERVPQAQQEKIAAACSTALRHDWALEVKVSHAAGAELAITVSVDVPIA